IRSRSGFDVEAFSKVELPVFLAYELGAGRGTRAAVHWLGRREVRWNSNFYAGRGGRYVEGGGNGASMRIQPHVWVAPGFRPDAYLPDVVRDAVVTHGHPRGILGAAFHALSLGTTLRNAEVPASSVWAEMAMYLARVPDLMASDEGLADRWLPLWEREQGSSWPEAVRETVSELNDLAARASKVIPGRNGKPVAEAYASLAREIGGLDPKTRGAGTISAVLALWLARSSRVDPVGALTVAANLRGSDTDTVATMAGALLGAVAEAEPPGALLDRDLHAREAARLDRIRNGDTVEDFLHPDSLHWRPPRTLSDAVGTTNGELGVAGLGPASQLSDPRPGNDSDSVAWQWLRLRFGQTVLIKRRLQLEPLPKHALPRPRAKPVPKQTAQSTLFDRQDAHPDRSLPDEVEEGVAMVAAHGFEHILIARMLAHFARQPGGVDKAGQFGSLLAKALREHDGLKPPAAQ
ncbi:MAG: ADP-ribosylglycohydrolase family protein, partial [Actinobacteria bacterium]|nr:ADP-ribosylglycohydrolase family protein [Actinomycetota bacterium]